MTTVISFDPGKITGIAYGEFTDEEPLSLLWTEAIGYEWFIDGTFKDRFRTRYAADHIVIEEFTLRNNEFAADLTGVRIEGILDWWYYPIVWRQPSKKSQVPDQVLKDHGLWQTGKDVDWEDGRDANDAIIHLLGYVAFDLKHKPTLRRYFK